MGQTIQAARVSTNVPIGVLITRDGGIGGLTVIARLFNGDDLSQFLDFADGVFKDAGHASPTLALAEVQATTNPGFYAVDGGFDLSAITVPAAAASLLVQYEITAGGESGNDVDVIQFTDALDAVLADTAAIEPLVSTNLDATVSSREAESAAATREATNTAEHAATIAQGDIAWITATGFSTHTAADVDTLLSANHGGGSWVGAGLTAAEAIQLQEVWASLGLNIAAPASFDFPGGFVQALANATPINIVISVVGTTVTLARQP